MVCQYALKGWQLDLANGLSGMMKVSKAKAIEYSLRRAVDQHCNDPAEFIDAMERYLQAPNAAPSTPPENDV